MNATVKNTMTVKQTLKCAINAPEKWQDDYNDCDSEDFSNLPDLAPAPVYSVDDYAACPDNWEHGSDIAGSYFVGLAEDGALWLDFNECFNHTHDVAVVLSVQGINPITGQTLIGDNPLRMEQYHKNCPVHNTPFKQDYFCDDCGFSWPGQNYMSTTGTPFGMFWLDGFRTPDGNVRQYVISAEKMRSVAAQVMEKRGEDAEDRVHAIGIAFYLSKDKKPEIPKFEMPKFEEPAAYMGSLANSGSSLSSPLCFSPMHTPQNWKSNHVKGSTSGSSTSSSSTSSVSSQPSNKSLRSKMHLMAQSMVKPIRKSLSHDNVDAVLGEKTCGDIYESLDLLGGDPISTSMDYGCDSIHVMDEAESRAKRPEMYTGNRVSNLDMDEVAQPVETVVPVKKLEVGAGALVSQRVYDDPKNLKKYWEEKPAGMIYVNYCDPETLKKILDGGKKATKKDGFMDGVQVG